MVLTHLLRHPLLAVAEPAAALLERLADARAKPNPIKAAGRTGERLAYFHLRRHGYTVVARQWRAPNLNGEIDLIAWHGETLCFVEVKTRTRSDRFTPAYAIDPHKQTALRRMAAAYVRGLPWKGEEAAQPAIRFDGVFIVLEGKTPQITLQPSIF